MITLEKTADYNRVVVFGNLPKMKPDTGIIALKVQFQYVEMPNEGNRTGKAIALDNQVIPAIHNAFECRRQLQALSVQVKSAGLIVPPAVEKALKGAQ